MQDLAIGNSNFDVTRSLGPALNSEAYGFDPQWVLSRLVEGSDLFKSHGKVLALLKQETNPTLFFQSLFYLATRLEKQDRPLGAARIYGLLAHADLKDSMPHFLVDQAKQRLELLSAHGGGFGDQLELFGKGLVKSAFDFSSMVGMGSSVVFAHLGRMWSVDWFKGFAPPRLKALSYLTGFAMEVGAFSMGSRLAQGVLGHSLDWNPATVGLELFGNTLRFGGLHLGAKLLANDALVHPIRRHVGMLAGVGLGLFAERSFSLPGAERGDLLAKSLLSWVQLNIAGLAFQRISGQRFSAWQEAMQRITQAKTSGYLVAKIPQLLAKESRWLMPGQSPRPLPVVEFPYGEKNLKSGETLKVVTYNIGYASGAKNNTTQALTADEVYSNLDATIASLKTFGADVIFLQEIDFASARTHRIDQMDYLARGLGMSFGAPVVTWDVQYLPFPFSLNPKHHFGRVLSGQLILSRHPILAHEAIKFEKPKSNPFWYNWLYLDRIAQRVSIEVGDKEMDLWQVHLEPFDPATRHEQTQRLASWVMQRQGSYKLVAGDFNSASDFRSHLGLPQMEELVKLAGKDRIQSWVQAGKPIDADTIQATQQIVHQAQQMFFAETGMANAGTEPPFFTFPTWDSTGPWMKIDQIGYSSEVYTVLQVKTEPTLLASDHAPILVELIPRPLP